MLKLHFAPNSRAVRTLWLLEELGLEYELNRMDFHPKDLKSDEHRARHPLGRIPVLEDGDMTIWESGAIAEYILERHKNGGLKPSPDAPNYPKYLQWFHYCEGMVMPPINTIVVHTISEAEALQVNFTAVTLMASPSKFLMIWAPRIRTTS